MKKLVLILTFIFISCNEGKQPEFIENYKGGIIYDKKELCGDLVYFIRYKNEIRYVKVYRADFTYNIKDTIK